MAAPTTPPDFATDPTFTPSGDDWDGGATRVDPGGTVRAQGFEPGILLPAEHLNFMIGNHGDWIDWINDETLAPGLRVDRFSPYAAYPVQATSPGTDPATIAQVNGVGTLQGHHLISNVNFGALHLPVSDLIPDGSDVYSIKAFVAPGNTRAVTNTRMSLRVFGAFPNWATPASGMAFLNDGTSVTDDGTTAFQVIEITPSITIGRSSAQYIARLTFGDDARTNQDKILGWEIGYLGPKRR